VPPVGIACCNGSSPAYFGMRSSVETGKQAGSLSMGKDVVRREKKKEGRVVGGAASPPGPIRSRGGSSAAASRDVQQQAELKLC